MLRSEVAVQTDLMLHHLDRMAEMGKEMKLAVDKMNRFFYLAARGNWEGLAPTGVETPPPVALQSDPISLPYIPVEQRGSSSSSSCDDPLRPISQARERMQQRLQELRQQDGRLRLRQQQLGLQRHNRPGHPQDGRLSWIGSPMTPDAQHQQTDSDQDAAGLRSRSGACRSPFSHTSALAAQRELDARMCASNPLADRVRLFAVEARWTSSTPRMSSGMSGVSARQPDCRRYRPEAEALPRYMA